MRRMVRGNRGGSSAVEFALLTPAVLFITFAAIDYAWYFHQLLVVQNAVRMAARTASFQEMTNTVDGVCEDCVAAAETKLEDSLTSLGVAYATDDFDITLVELNDGPGEWAVRVAVDIDYLPFTGGLVPMPPALATTLTMRIDNQ